MKELAGAAADVDLQAEDLEEIVRRSCRSCASTPAGRSRAIPYEQLEVAIKAVFDSWMGREAVDYRREFGITSDMANGTAANVVAMVFGNMGDDCATGVAFTRNPGDGRERALRRVPGQRPGRGRGGGIRTPKPIRGDGAPRRCRDSYAQLAGAARQAGEALPRGAGLRVHDRDAAPCTACRRATGR